jgi:TonB family protein
LLLSLVTPALTGLHALLPAAISWGQIPAQAGASVAVAGTGEGFAVHSGTLLLPGAVIWLVFAIYVSALAWFSAKFLWSIAAARAFVRESAPLRLAAEGEEIWERARREFGAANAVLLCSASVAGIVTAGARRPAILVPPDFAGRWTDDDLLSALGHELAHVRRRDYAKNLLYESAATLIAFHPVIWIVKAQIARTREMICDAMVVERLVDRKRYRQSLLSLAKRMAAGRAAQALGMFDANILEERITMMKSTRTIPNRLVRIALTGCATLLILAAAIGGTAFAKGVAADSNARPSKVYKIGHGVTAPVLTWAPDPKFTNQARKAHYQGVCVVGLIVGIDGHPTDVHVVRPLGMGLDKNAVKAVKNFRFKPAIFEGKPVPVKINVEVNFRLYDDSKPSR